MDTALFLPFYLVLCQIETPELVFSNSSPLETFNLNNLNASLKCLLWSSTKRVVHNGPVICQTDRVQMSMTFSTYICLC